MTIFSREKKKTIHVDFWHGGMPENAGFLDRFRNANFKRFQFHVNPDGTVLGFEYYGTVGDFVTRFPHTPLMKLCDADTIYTTQFKNFGKQ